MVRLKPTRQPPDLSSSEPTINDHYYHCICQNHNICSIEDVNDIPPIFKRKTYEGFMTQDLSRLRNNLQVSEYLQKIV